MRILVYCMKYKGNSYNDGVHIFLRIIIAMRMTMMMAEDDKKLTLEKIHKTSSTNASYCHSFP